jgi:hypothetical protein
MIQLEKVNSSYRMGEVVSRNRDNGYSLLKREYFQGGRMATRRHDIIRGFSIGDLALWVLEPMIRIGDGSFRSRTFTFGVDSLEKVIEFSITKIQMEDGSGKRWFIDGWGKGLSEKATSRKFYSYFDFNSRTGWIEFE